MATDVVELILADHRRFEELFRQLRDRSSDRSALLGELAALLVAHAEAEESEVYPALKRYREVDAEEVDHGAEEHAEGHQALLALMEEADTGSEEWEEKLEELVDALNHHVDEEERTILNDAREQVADERRAELGELFARVRQDRLDDDCGDLEYVRKLAKATADRID
ncbi:hemerythrin domain-containing protein [Saccharothrix algeriensis]|uniref:Hemerythrin domain-containing protein n=1 Tax=Saccharothrix algeriensis TaxID=173560 RepID=A0A8T8I3B7_9PSEU|nr:hemerythrin domain-containing protein [Saccharothrix algeriensis]MBM7811165.1 hemerythrin superfamily protein [Saccharothrix algeriensis]QTR05088.1 hemerythrin domain-containing protein [Saccharothrix algeriensis]